MSAERALSRISQLRDEDQIIDAFLKGLGYSEVKEEDLADLQIKLDQMINPRLEGTGQGDGDMMNDLISASVVAGALSFLNGEA